MLTTKAWVRLVLIVAAFVISVRAVRRRPFLSSDDGHRQLSCGYSRRGAACKTAQRLTLPQATAGACDRGGVWVDRGSRGLLCSECCRHGARSAGGGSGVTISCSSERRWKALLSLESRPVQLIRQRSQSACREGYSWGQDGRGIWVDHGCRADFAVDSYQYGGGGYGTGSGGGVAAGGRFLASSGRWPALTTLREQRQRGRVSLARQRSESACTEGYSWGQDGRGVWVDHGCRADFNVGGGWNGGGWDRDRDRDWNRGNNGSDADLVVSCASDDMHRHYCPADTRGGVRLLKQHSDSSCRQGYSWGFDRRGIRVDHGCRADFQVVR